MGNFAAKQHAGVLSAFAAAALSLLAMVVALVLLLAAPKVACADETPVFKAAENVTIWIAEGIGIFGGADDPAAVFLAANDAAENLTSAERDALVASVVSSDESIVRVEERSVQYTSNEYTSYGPTTTAQVLVGVKKGSATVTVTDVYGNVYSNVIRVEYAAHVNHNIGNDGVMAYMHRLYNPNSGEHFYTSDVDEVDSLVTAGWNYEGIGWAAPSSSNTPVYRMYNPNPGPNGSGEHHYTTSVAEKEMLEAAGWNYEGIGWYSDDNEEIPLYRLYNPNEFNNNHHYTRSTEERDYLLSLGWRDEGIAWYGTIIADG